MASRMLPIRPGNSAIRSISKRRPSCSQPFSTSSSAAALSPYRKSQSKPAQREPSKRPATTAAAPAPYVIDCPEIARRVSSTDVIAEKGDQYPVLHLIKTTEMSLRRWCIVKHQSSTSRMYSRSHVSGRANSAQVCWTQWWPDLPRDDAQAWRQTHLYAYRCIRIYTRD